MAKIQLLSEETINQIAAGEVIENPASVVKELVENSVDAGATEISVSIRGGGLLGITVSDNGLGMSAEDALLSLQRHATSKIQNSHDLFRLVTMGFRGEALASLAAISKMTLLTSEGELGTRIEVEGGKVVEVSPHPRNRGTTIEVRALFYNVPARKKFQKSPALCSGEVSRTMTLLALAHSGIAITYLKQEEEVFKVLPNHSEREKILLGEAFLEGCYRLEKGAVRGILGSPLQSRPNRSGQYVFLNGRPIFSPIVSFAVRDGYGTRLSDNRYPIFLLYLTIDPAQVDVNVHPQKREVRFQDEWKLKSLIRETVSHALDSIEPPIFAPFNSFMPVMTPLPSTRLREEPLPSFFEEKLPFLSDNFRSLGVYGGYYFVEDEGELWVVDLSAVQAAILYEKTVMRQIDAQRLLFPESFEVNHEEAALLVAQLSFLKEVGFEIGQVGPRAFMIEAIPAYMAEGNLKEIMLELGHLALEKEDLFPRMAQLLIRSRRIKRNFMVQEAEVLYREFKQHASCFSKGKPIRIRLNGDEIATFFSKRL